MKVMNIVIRHFQPLTASDADLQPVHVFLTQMEAERNPTDPARTLETTIKAFRSFPLLTDEKAIIFYAWHEAKIVGEAFIVIGLDEENSHLLSGDIQVLAEYRRQGIGKELLRKVAEVAEAENRRLILATTDSMIPPGVEFARWAGALPALTEDTSELRLSEVDLDMLASWKATAPDEGYRLLTWLGPYPDNYLVEMANLQEVMNSAPIGDLELEDERVTPQDIRESEAYEASRGFERWTVVAQHIDTGTLVGYTEVDWHPDKPQLLNQGDTVVAPEHRQQGIGVWLKATMIELALDKRPDVTRVRTETASANKAMKALNNRLGFQPYKTRTEWQLSTEAARLAFTKENVGK